MALGSLRRDPSHQLDAIQFILDWRESLSHFMWVGQNFIQTSLEEIFVFNNKLVFLLIILVELEDGSANNQALNMILDD